MRTLHTGTLPTIIVSILLPLIAACTAGGGSASGPGGLTLIHTNDTYRIDAVENGTAGGFGRLVTVTRDALAEGRDVRLTHGGDFLYPSLESQVWDGAQMVDALNFLDRVAPLYAVIGNHETDPRSPDALAAAVRASTYDWIGDNYRFVTGQPDVDAALRRDFTFEAGGYTIGVFALTMHADDGGNDRAYLPVDADYAGIAEQAIRRLEAAGADLIFGLTHLHIWEDERIAALRANHPSFQFIVGGHEHEPEYLHPSADRAAVMKGASNARSVWRIDIDAGRDGQPVVTDARLVTLDERVAGDPDYDALEQKWRAQLLEKFPFITARVGVATAPMDAREVTIRNRESAWGSFIADQMRGAFGSPAADLAFLNSGTLRLDDWIRGDIHFEDIGRTFGFSSFLRRLTLSGAEFRQILEAGYRGAAPSQGYFPQVSGFRVCVNRSRPAGQRIVSLQVPAEDGWSDIDPDRHYNVIVPDFLYRGGDGYRFPQDRDVSLPASELKYLVLDAIMAAQAEGRTVGTPVDPANPRIVIRELPGAACFPGDG